MQLSDEQLAEIRSRFDSERLQLTLAALKCEPLTPDEIEQMRERISSLRRTRESSSDGGFDLHDVSRLLATIDALLEGRNPATDERGRPLDAAVSKIAAKDENASE
jgi:hypothetical protein